MDQVLEIAAFACLAVGVALLVVRFAGPALSRRAQAFRFRRNLKRLEAVADRWAMELPPRPPRGRDPLAPDPILRPRPDLES